MSRSGTTLVREPNSWNVASKVSFTKWHQTSTRTRCMSFKNFIAMLCESQIRETQLQKCLPRSGTRLVREHDLWLLRRLKRHEKAANHYEKRPSNNKGQDWEALPRPRRKRNPWKCDTTLTGIQGGSSSRGGNNNYLLECIIQPLHTFGSLI